MKTKQNKNITPNFTKIFVLYKGDGPINNIGQYIGAEVGWTNNFDFASKWSKDNKGYYAPLDLISSNN